MRKHPIGATAFVTTAVVVTALLPAVTTAAATEHLPRTRHVLLLSIDGMHESDLRFYVRHHPGSALARLTHRGIDYRHARTTFLSDSFPGMVAQLTGGTPGTTGVYYDDTFNHALLPAGTTNCASARRGTEVSWTEAADRSSDPITLDAGQNIDNPALQALPSNTKRQTLTSAKALTQAILKLTPTPQSLLNPTALPVDPRTCTPVYPHQYLRVNTVFDVARRAGLRTAWSDKHPAYEILNGPSGAGIQDLFTPEINGVADASGDDWSTDNALTQEYDSFKVAAVLNEIAGRNHEGTTRVGTPGIFGMNFQTLSTAQKLPESDGLRGGYHRDGTPGPLVTRAMNFVNRKLGAMLRGLRTRHLLRTTTIILSAKHGQSPIRPQLLRRVDDGAILDNLDQAWAATHPHAAPLVTFSVDDDVMLLWLSDNTRAAHEFATRWLMRHNAPANTVSDPAGSYSAHVTHSGLTRIVTGLAVDRLFGAPRHDAHAPDLVGITQPGVVYTGKVSKIAEHGGASPADRHVPLLVSGAGVTRASSGAVVTRPVLTTQIAPTILALLGLRPGALQAVHRDHTRVLPRLG